MFQSYEYKDVDSISFQYRIIDSEFEETKIIRATNDGSPIVGILSVRAVEEIYKRRGYTNKQIAKQLFLCFRDAAAQNNFPLDEIIKRNKIFNPEIMKTYGEHIKLFLLFT
jgi:hypothetical protein